MNKKFFPAKLGFIFWTFVSLSFISNFKPFSFKLSIIFWFFSFLKKAIISLAAISPIPSIEVNSSKVIVINLSIFFEAFANILEATFPIKGIPNE